MVRGGENGDARFRTGKGGGVPMDKPCPIVAGGGSMKSRSIKVDINLGETLLVGNKERSPLRFNSNS